MEEHKIEENRCCLCLENQENKIRIILVCGHAMDYNCFLNLRKPSCPLCRKEIDTPTQFIAPQYLSSFTIESEEEQPPTPSASPFFPPSYSSPLLTRQNASDLMLTMDLSDFITPQRLPHLFRNQNNRFIVNEDSRERTIRRRQERRQRQRETRRRYRREEYSPLD
jgi:hypothetical protein